MTKWCMKCRTRHRTTSPCDKEYDAMVAELVNLYHLARTALAGQGDTRHARMIWASRAYAKEHGTNETAAYKTLSRALENA